jgi:surface protein
MLAVKETSSTDVLFALNPETSDWAERGFTSHSNWWAWNTLGYTPEQADPDNGPPVDDVSLVTLATKHLHEPAGWETLDTSVVTTIRALFESATEFNADISNWDVSNVTNMDHMFRNAKAFNQSLANWDITNVEDMNHMFSGSGISAQNLSETLAAWAHHATTKTVRPFVLLYGLPHTYTSLTKPAQQGINTLCNKHGWRINFEQP